MIAYSAMLDALHQHDVEEGSRLVPYAEGPKRAPNGARTLSLNCADTIEVQACLDGRIHPKPAPHRAVYQSRLTCQYRHSVMIRCGPYVPVVPARAAAPRTAGAWSAASRAAGCLR